MKRTFLVGVAIFLAIVVAGCGGGDSGPALIVTDINSDGGAADGDITFTGGQYYVTTSDQSPFSVVVDLRTASETRGFITFSLLSIPVDASIRRATVFLPVMTSTPLPGSTSVILEPDMVEFPLLSTLTTFSARQAVFDAPWIVQLPSLVVSATPSVVSFDATSAVIEANRPPALPSLQIRLMSQGGLVDIDDLYVLATDSGVPVLRVEYF